MFTSFLAGIIFKRYCTETWMKLLYLALAQIITGLFLLLTPWMTSFPLLILTCIAYGMGLGFFDTGMFISM